MPTEKDLDEREKQLLKDRAGYKKDSSQYATLTAKINQLERAREKLNSAREGKDKWKMFWISQIIPLIALAISIYALYKSSSK